jgi:hypothetical protein
MPDFMPLFVASRGKPIDFEGQLLHSALHLALAPSSRIHILFESSATRPVQGLSISAERPKHRLGIAGMSARHFVLWRDTAPRHVEVELPRARQPVLIAIHNVWRDEKYGTTMYGTNAAAMRVTEERVGKWLLECSDGWGTDAHFGDLVVRVVLEPASGSAA